MATVVIIRSTDGRRSRHSSSSRRVIAPEDVRTGVAPDRVRRPFDGEPRRSAADRQFGGIDADEAGQVRQLASRVGEQILVAEAAEAVAEAWRQQKLREGVVGVPAGGGGDRMLPPHGTAPRPRWRIVLALTTR